MPEFDDYIRVFDDYLLAFDDYSTLGILIFFE